MAYGNITTSSWLDAELSGPRFRDARLGARLRTLMAQMSGAVGAPIPQACQDRANTKAAYRFLSNADVSEREIHDGHCQAAAARSSATYGLVLVLYQPAVILTYEDCQSRLLARSGGEGDVVHRRTPATKSSGRDWQPGGRILAGIGQESGDCVAPSERCTTSPLRTLLAENRQNPSS